MKLQKQHTNFLAFVLFVLVPWLVFPSLALAEFRSVSVPKAILYDSPSPQANKLFILSQGYPVEVIVNLAEWVKVRDNQGSLNWIDAKQLSPKRTLLVTASNVEIKQSPEAGSEMVGRLEKDVVVDFVELAKTGWVKIKHRDGLTGFIQTSAVWGL